MQWASPAFSLFDYYYYKYYYYKYYYYMCGKCYLLWYSIYYVSVNSIT